MPSASKRVRPSNTLIKTALDVESVASCGCKDGGSEATTKFNSLEEAVSDEPESFFYRLLNYLTNLPRSRMQQVLKKILQGLLVIKTFCSYSCESPLYNF